MDRIIVEADAKKTGYRYFAFISYSSKDVKWAEWIQKKLETYRLPSKIRKEHSDLPEKIAPVFRDDTDLSGVVLEEALHKELDESKFLIVVCTPESAASKWVGDEIKYFRSIGGEKRIIPLIVGSETDLIDECVHEEIKRIKPELLGIDVDKLGKSNAFLRLVATMLELHYDELLMRERKSWIKRRIVAGVAAFLLLSGMIGLWYYNAEHSSYYSNYILRYEIPEGVEKLSGSDVAKRVSSYKIVKKRGKVIRLETVNNKKVLSSGIVYYEEINEFPLQEYSYDDSGRLSEITMKNENRDIIGVKSLSYGEGNIAIDYRYAEDGISVNTNDSAYGYYIDGETGRSEVIRQINSYNEEGFRTEERYYRDNLGHTAVNELGVYGKQYVYTDEGFIESVIFIDDNGKKSNCKYGYAEMRQEYSGSKINKSTYLDEKGAPARNSKGVSIYEAEYDEVGNYIKIERFSEEGNLCKDKDNVAVMYFSTEKGEYQGAKYYDEENNPTLNDTGVHEVRWKRNKDGWIIEENYYDTEGKAVRVKGDRDLAARVAIGNTITVVGKKAHWILDNETSSAEKYGYKGSNQIEDAWLVANDEGTAAWDKTQAVETTVKAVMETPVTEDITNKIFKVNALINKAEGAGFVNYYINDLDETTGSYAYTQCSGSDFAWLDACEAGKVYTVYFAVINAKSSSSGCLWRFLPIEVVDDNFVANKADAAKFFVEYYGVGQIQSLYYTNPELVLNAKVSSKVYGIEEAHLQFSSEDPSIISILPNSNGEYVMSCKTYGTTNVVVYFNGYGGEYTAKVEVTYKEAPQIDSISVAEAIATAPDTEVTVKGIVGPSLVNQDGFYLFSEQGDLIAVKVVNKEEVFANIEIGHEVIVKGMRERYINDDTKTQTGQTCIVDAEILQNNYGSHEYSTAKFVTDKTPADCMLWKLRWTILRRYSL